MQIKDRKCLIYGEKKDEKDETCSSEAKHICLRLPVFTCSQQCFNVSCSRSNNSDRAVSMILSMPFFAQFFDSVVVRCIVVILMVIV